MLQVPASAAPASLRRALPFTSVRSGTQQRHPTAAVVGQHAWSWAVQHRARSITVGLARASLLHSARVRRQTTRKMNGTTYAATRNNFVTTRNNVGAVQRWSAGACGPPTPLPARGGRNEYNAHAARGLWPAVLRRASLLRRACGGGRRSLQSF